MIHSYEISCLLSYFEYEHLPRHLQEVSGPFCLLAKNIAHKTEDSPELAAGLRKLLEAKDCIVRASLKPED